jgi:hypothetical protein
MPLANGSLLSSIIFLASYEENGDLEMDAQDRKLCMHEKGWPSM